MKTFYKDKLFETIEAATFMKSPEILKNDCFDILLTYKKNSLNQTQSYP